MNMQAALSAPSAPASAGLVSNETTAGEGTDAFKALLAAMDRLTSSEGEEAQAAATKEGLDEAGSPPSDMPPAGEVLPGAASPIALWAEDGASDAFAVMNRKLAAKGLDAAQVQGRAGEATGRAAEASAQLPGPQPSSVVDAPVPQSLSVEGLLAGASGAAKVGEAPALPAAPAPQEAALAARPERLGADVGVEIVRQMAGGKSDFSIRLDPPELGRIDVKLELAPTGEVRGVIAADNPATQEMLRRDEAALLRLFLDQGLKADSGALKFEQRQTHASATSETDTAVTAGEDPAGPAVAAPRRAAGLLDLIA